MNPLNSKIDLSLSFNKLKTIIMAKATIKKVINPNGDHFFQVYKDGSYQYCVGYLPERGDTDPLGEKIKYAEALALAKIIENDVTPIEETVYETPDTNEDLPPGVFETPGI